MNGSQWVVAKGNNIYGQPALDMLPMIMAIYIPLVKLLLYILLLVGKILRVGNMENTSGSSWSEIRNQLFPMIIQEKFDHVPYTDELFQHLIDRRETPEPPWIVLYATSMP